MSNTREDWSELAVAAGGVDLVPMTTRIRLCCSPTHNNAYCQPQQQQGYHSVSLRQPVLWLIITVTHKSPWAGHSHKNCSHPTTYIKRENCLARSFYFNLNMTNFQHLLQRDNENILLFLCPYITDPAARASKSLRFQHATVFKIGTNS
jgi:hypothetical protein